MQSCKYFYEDKNGKEELINNEYCECSLMEESDEGGAVKDFDLSK